MSALSTVVEEARKRYVDVSKPHVTIYIADTVCDLSLSLMLPSCNSTNHTLVLTSQAMVLASSGITSNAKVVAHLALSSSSTGLSSP